MVEKNCVCKNEFLLMRVTGTGEYETSHWYYFKCGYKDRFYKIFPISETSLLE